MHRFAILIKHQMPHCADSRCSGDFGSEGESRGDGRLFEYKVHNANERLVHASNRAALKAA